MAATLADQPVQCTESEAAYFNVPPGQTCESYASAFVQAAGQGYLTNPTATSACGYCQFASGVEYMRDLNVQPQDKWRDLGIFIIFVITNYALVYLFIYTVRVKGWSFGMSTLFGGLGRLVDVAKKPFTKKEVSKE